MTTNSTYNIDVTAENCVTLAGRNIQILFGLYNDRYYIWITRGLSDSTTSSPKRKDNRNKGNKVKLQMERKYEFAIIARKDDDRTYELLSKAAINVITMMMNIHFNQELNFISHINVFGCSNIEINDYGVSNCLVTKLTGSLKQIVTDTTDVCVISNLYNGESDALSNNKISNKDLLRTSIEKGINYLIYNLNRPIIY
jgi:hypothetical protein